MSATVAPSPGREDRPHVVEREVLDLAGGPRLAREDELADGDRLGDVFAGAARWREKLTR